METGKGIPEVKERGFLRSQFTKVMNKIKAELQDGNLDVSGQMVLLEEKFVRITALDRLILRVAFESPEVVDPEKEFEESESYRESFLLLKHRVTSISAAKVSPSMKEKESLSSPMKSRLPKISLPHFKGDSREWPDFKQMFDVAASSLDDAEKFILLKTLLEKEAADAIRNIPLKGENFRIAIDILTNRYGRKEIQQEALMNQLLSLRSVSDDRRPEEMRKMVDSLSSIVRALQSEGLSSDKYGSLLKPILESKIPVSLRVQWGRQRRREAPSPLPDEQSPCASDDWTEKKLDDFLKFLEEETQILEEAVRSKVRKDVLEDEKAAMKLRKLRTNVRSLQKDASSEEKVLGIPWDQKSDELGVAFSFKTNEPPKEISIQEEKDAEGWIFRNIQSAVFSEEKIKLASGDKISGKSRLATLAPFMEDGFVKMGGRIGFSTTLEEREKHPIILSRCGAVDLFIQWIHEKCLHGGVGLVIVEMRKRGLWVLTGKRGIRAVILKCRQCKRRLASPFHQEEAPFPKERLHLEKPFLVTGVDLAGPMYIDDGRKVWITVFTCMGVRAVHLELVSNLSEEALRRAVLRFLGRRGRVQMFWSDHGTNFVALSKFVQNVGVEWRFIVERAPWWGGAWERIVALVKNLLRPMLGRGKYTQEEIYTMLVQVESLLNKRPISYVFEGGQFGIPVPLIPEQFLIMGSEVNKEQKPLNDRLIQTQEWGREVKRRWKEEYLTQVLGEAKKSKFQKSEIEIGEVVLVGGTGRSREFWKLGVVEEKYRGSDGLVRAVKLKMPNGTIKRPVQLLYPMEVKGELSQIQRQAESEEEAEEEEEIENEDDVQTESVTRRGRKVKIPLRYLD